MENINAEQIIKALECCTSESSKCADCPRYSFVPCTKSLLTDALTLIKELTEEKEKLGNLIDEIEKEKRELFEENKRLTEENERLKSVEFTCGFVKPHKVLECPIFDEIARTKADTVRKMQTEIKKTFSAICKGEMGDLYRIIDQIAKEMLEGAK